MPNHLTWTDAFALGYGPMDDTHREFVDIVHAMQTCQDDELLGHLKRFEQHAVAHFDQELEWMKSTDFPSTDCHDDEHKAVLASVHDVLTKLEAGDVALARSLVQALVDWFPGHADYLDSALALWMVKRRKGGAPVVIRRTIASANIPDSP